MATAKVAIDQYGMMVDSDIEAISAAMWSFLSTCVSGTAMTIFESIEVLSGLDAWRQLHNHIQKGSATRRLTLREPAIHPRAARSEEEISMAITKWETDYKRYLEAGGSELNDEDLRMTLLQLLPQQLREALLWRATESRSYGEFREHVRIKAEQILMLRHKLPAYHVESPGAGGGGLEDTETGRWLREEFPEAKDEEILALVGRLGARSGNRPPGATRRPAAPGPAREVRCANCGGYHAAKDCSLPWIEDPTKRVCFICGKPGCRSNRCPNRPNQNANGGRDGGRNAPRGGRPQNAKALEEINLEVCALESDFQPVRRGARPMPAGATMGDHIQVAMNRFHVKEDCQNIDSEEDKYVVTNDSSFEPLIKRANARSCDSDRKLTTKIYNKIFDIANAINSKRSLELTEMVMKSVKPGRAARHEQRQGQDGARGQAAGAAPHVRGHGPEHRGPGADLRRLWRRRGGLHAARDHRHG